MPVREFGTHETGIACAVSYPSRGKYSRQSKSDFFHAESAIPAARSTT